MMRTITGNVMAITIALLGIVGCAGERPQNLGTRDGLLVACPSSPNCVSSQAADEGHRIAALTFNDDPETAFSRLKQILGRRDDTVLTEVRPEYLRVELHTNLFVDDGEFLLDQSRSAIQVRSASRLGYSDLGKNRSRMEEIRTQFSAGEGK